MNIKRYFNMEVRSRANNVKQEYVNIITENLICQGLTYYLY